MSNVIYIYIMKSNGPKIEPWGTPVVKVSVFDVVSFISTLTT